MTPFLRDDGSTLLVNRDFVLPQWHARQHGSSPSAVTVTGLLRMSEPGWGFLRHNDPATGRWYSHEVTAIAAAQGLGAVAPYFIDADASPARPKRRTRPWAG